MLDAAGLRSPHPHARIIGIDTTRAEALAGVRAVFSHVNAGDFINPATKLPIFGEELLYHGDLVALVVAETPEQAREAARRLRSTYEPLPFVADPEAALAPDAPTSQHRPCHQYHLGRVSAHLRAWRCRARACRRRSASRDATWRRPPPCTTRWRRTVARHPGMDARLTVWSSTQDVFGARAQVASALGLPQNQVQVITQYMGGGFGSKFGAHRSGLLAAYAVAPAWAAREVPARAAPRRISTLAIARRASRRYRLGATRDGTLTALDLRCYSTMPARSAVGSARWRCPPRNSISAPTSARSTAPVRTNLGTLASFRAPGVVEGIGRAGDRDRRTWPHSSAWIRWSCAARTSRNAIRLLDRPYARKLLLRGVSTSARNGSAGPRAMPTSGASPLARDGHLRRGVGMASQLWGGDGGPPAQAIAKLLPDGTAVILTGTQDIGTGTRTVLAQIAAEELGYPLDACTRGTGRHRARRLLARQRRQHDARLGRPRRAHGRRRGAQRDAGDHRPSRRGAGGCAGDPRRRHVFDRETGRDMGSVSVYLEQLDGHEITAKGMRGPNAEDVTVRTFGAQFAEVEVDIGTGAGTRAAHRRGT